MICPDLTGLRPQVSAVQQTFRAAMSHALKRSRGKTLEVGVDITRLVNHKSVCVIQCLLFGCETNYYKEILSCK